VVFLEKSYCQKAACRQPVAAMIKRVLFFGAYLLFCLACFLLVFEAVYRYQLVDFYRPELRANNRAADLRDTTSKTLLVVGDSVSPDLNTCFNEKQIF
jgi:hypothetical protein